MGEFPPLELMRELKVRVTRAGSRLTDQQIWEKVPLFCEGWYDDE